MLQIQNIASYITTTDQTVHVCAVLNCQALNKANMGTSLCGVTMTLKQQGKMETSFFLNRIHFSTNNCMFDTLTKKAHGITQLPTLTHQEEKKTHSNRNNNMKVQGVSQW